MTTVTALHEDLLYIILSKCTSSIDVWHLLLALGYELPQMRNLRAFWSHIRLSSLHNSETLLSFIKQIAMYCIDLRIDNLNWMAAADVRRLLSYFRLAVSFHSGNVALSKSILIHDVKSLFPFLKYISLLVSLDDVTSASSSARQSATADDMFQGICASLNEMPHLEHISLVLQEKKGGSLSHTNARVYLRLVCEYISNITTKCTMISMEENGYDITQRFPPVDAFGGSSLGSVNLALPVTVKHSIVSFRPMPDMKLTLATNESVEVPLQLATLVLPCVPATWNSIDLNELKILDIGYVNIGDREELLRLDELLRCHHRGSLRNLSLSLSDWQSARLVVRRKRADNQQSTTSSVQVDSVFANCFEQMTTPDENETSLPNPFIEEEKSSEDSIDELVLEFVDNTPSTTFQLPLRLSWLTNLTNLNLTGVHCHSIDFKHLFHSLSLLRSLSLSPCLLLYIDQLECHCQTIKPRSPYQIHSLNPNLLSLTLASDLSDLTEPCAIFLEQYKLHCIRHSSVHQHLRDKSTAFHYDAIIRLIIRTIVQTLDLHHLSIRIPNYQLQMDDLDIQPNNHLESLILDVKLPITFFSKLTRLYSEDRLQNLRRFLLISENNFELTPLLIDRFRSLEIIEILSRNCRLNRSTMQYLETVLKPHNYPSLTTFRLQIGSIDANHLLKRLHKTVRSNFENARPAFVFDISIVQSATRSQQTRPCILYDRTHDIHRSFHSLLSSQSHQLSISYPNYLNSKPLYSEMKFDK